MKISFIVPVYNCEKSLESCIYGIESIGLNEYEILLIDDGSTDNSGYVCDNLVQKNKKIQCIHQLNQGVSVARNNGLKVAKGDYIFFVDADDTIESSLFFDLITELEKEPEIDMVIFGLSFDYYNKNVLYYRDELKPPLTGIKNSTLWIQELQKLYYANALSPIWNKLFKRSFLIKNELYLREDMFLYEDLEYSLRCMTYCDNILFRPDVIYHYHRHEESAWRLRRIDHISSLVGQLETAFTNLLKEKHEQEKQVITENILLILYLVLAREKIAVSNFKEIGNICDDFAAWYNAKGYLENRTKQIFVNDLLKHRVAKLVIRRDYTVLRHKIAVKIKSSALYKMRNNL